MKLYSIVLFSLFYQISIKGMTILVTLYALHLNASPTLLGIIIASGSLFPMLLASFAGRMADRINLNFLLVVGMVGTGVTLFIPYFYPANILYLIGVQLLFGLFQILTVVSLQNLIGRISSTANRTKNYGAYTLSVSIANLIGPLIAGLTIDHVSYEATYLVFGIFSIMPAVYFMFANLQTNLIQTSNRNEAKKPKNLLFDIQLRNVFITSGIILTGVGLFEFYFPIYTESLGLSSSTIGMLVSIHSAGFIISRLLMVKLQNTFSPQQIISVCLYIAAGAFFFIPFMKLVPLLGLVAFILGLGLGCCQPLSIVMAYNESPSGQTGEVLGIRLTVNKAVQVAVPIVFSSMSFLGFYVIFWFNTIVLAIGGRILLKSNSYQRSEHPESFK